MGRKATSKATLEVREKELLALQYRMSGDTLDEVARKCGYVNHTGAKKAIDRLMARRETAATQEAIALELDRIDAVQKGIWPQVLRGNLSAIDRFVKLSQHRAEILGLYAARKAAVEGNLTTIDGTAVEAEMTRVLDLVMAATEEEPAVRYRLAAILEAQANARHAATN